MAKPTNNGIINTGPGTVVADGTILGDPDCRTATPGTNNGVINTGSGTVVASGAVMGAGNRRS